MAPVTDAGPSTSTLAKRVTGEGQKQKMSKKDSHRQQARVAGKLGPDRKKAFKAVFENPLHIEWPDIPLNVENAVLACAVQILVPVREYNEKKLSLYHQAKRENKPIRKRKRQKKSKDGAGGPAVIEEDIMDQTSLEQPQLADDSGARPKRKRQSSLSDGADENGEFSDTERPTKRQRSADEGHPTSVKVTPPLEATHGDPDGNRPEGSTTEASIPIPATTPRPEAIEHIIMGLNEVTKRLESQVKRRSDHVEVAPIDPIAASTATRSTLDQPLTTPTLPRPLRLVLVCRTDADTPAMIAHLPTLVATCNSRKPDAYPDVVLVALPLGAENTLAEATGLRRALVLGFDMDTPGLNLLEQFLSSIPVLSSPWLGLPPALPPTHIKHLATSTPKDAKVAKANRLEARKEAKKDRVASKPVMKAARPLNKVIIKAGVGKTSVKGPVTHRPAIKTLPKVIVRPSGSRRTGLDESPA